MSERVDASQIEQIVGCQRHQTWHYARAVSAEQTAYILHSRNCLGTRADLRQCPFSLALDMGLDPDVWAEVEDQTVRVTIRRGGRLVPVVPGMRLAP